MNAANMDLVGSPIDFFHFILKMALNIFMKDVYYTEVESVFIPVADAH